MEAKATGIDPGKIPEELKVGEQLLMWRFVKKGAGYTKIPYQVNGGQASSTDPATWTTFDKVIAALKGGAFSGIGRVVTPEDDDCGIDIDNCRDPRTSVISPEARRIIQLLNSYTEVTPSETGVRVWVKGEKAGRRCAKPGLEIYDRGRYFALTGWHLEGTPETIEARQSELDKLISAEFPTAKPPEHQSLEGSSLELENFLQDIGVQVLKAIHDTNSERAYGIVCPWAYEHTGGDISGTRVGQYPDGALWFQCEHAHCSNRGWREFREQLAPRNVFDIKRPKKIKDPTNNDYPDYRDSSDSSDYPDYPTPITAAKLLATEMAPVRWAVPDVLPEGVTLLAGKPKQGKSWAALGLCEAIAAGGVAFGTKKVEKGETLYLALEDNYRRMQKRLKKVLNGRECPEGMYVNTEWPRLDEGGAEALDKWLTEHPDARLVVIDTLAKIRKPARGKNVYQEDYSALEVLLPMAAAHGVAIVVVHHLRKGEAADAQDEISGSTGLAGGVDGYLILRRKPGSRGPTLFVDGRDIEEPQEYALHWNLNTATWTIEGTAEEVHISKERADILLELNRSPEPMTPKEVAEMLPGQKYANIKVLLRNMLQDDQVIKSGVGKYEPRRRTNPDYPSSADYPTDSPDSPDRNGVNEAAGDRVIEVIENGKETPVSFGAAPGKHKLDDLKVHKCEHCSPGEDCPFCEDDYR